MHFRYALCRHAARSVHLQIRAGSAAVGAVDWERRRTSPGRAQIYGCVSGCRKTMRERYQEKGFCARSPDKREKLERRAEMLRASASSPGHWMPLTLTSTSSRSAFLLGPLMEGSPTASELQVDAHLRRRSPSTSFSQIPGKRADNSTGQTSRRKLYEHVHEYRLHS